MRSTNAAIVLLLPRPGSPNTIMLGLVAIPRSTHSTGWA